jgi:hypothetical protein
VANIAAVSTGGDADSHNVSVARGNADCYGFFGVTECLIVGGVEAGCDAGDCVALAGGSARCFSVENCAAVGRINGSRSTYQACASVGGTHADCHSYACLAVGGTDADCQARTFSSPNACAAVSGGSASCEPAGDLNVSQEKACARVTGP